MGGVVPNSIPSGIDASKPSASQEYRSKMHPERFASLGNEDQFSESHTKSREDEGKRRDEELDKEAIARNLPKSSSQPNPDA
jgi:hypothetical protein